MSKRSTFLAGLVALGSVALASPATDIFKQAMDLITERYYGMAANSAELIEKHRAVLETACAKDADRCAVEVGTKQITELAKELDWRVILRAPPAVPPATPAEPKPIFGFRPWPNVKTPEIMITDVMPKSAAYKAGLLPGDRIVAINGQLFETPQSQAALYEAYSKLENAVPVDQPIRYTVLRGDAKSGSKLEVTITRSLDAEPGFPILYKPGGSPDGVLVLRIPSLSTAGAAQRVHDLVREAQKQNAKALVIHLMGVNDGTYRMINAVAGAFLGEFSYTFRTKESTYTSGFKAGAGLGYEKDTKVEQIENPALWTGKLAVITFRGNLAGGEFLPHLLQKTKRAVIIGEATQGYLQAIPDFFRLANGGQLLVPAYRAFNADGSLFPERVTPDVSIPYNQEEDAHTGVNPLLERAFKELGF